MFAQWLIADNGTSNSPQINAGVPGAVVVWPVRAHATNPSCHESIHGCWARAEGHVCMYVCGCLGGEGAGVGVLLELRPSATETHSTRVICVCQE